MRIAVTYDNGNIFQHFGRTETFKVYKVENNKVVSSELIGSNGAGHGALAALLSEQGIDVLICGGIGGGAQAALDEAGIVVMAGADGNADEAVETFLKGELESTGVNCDHHHENEEGHDCGAGCGGGCSGGCGGCHGGAVSDIVGQNVGKVVKVHYKGTFDDGTQFDSSYDRNEPLQFVCGAGMMIHGFDAAVANMDVGQILDIHLIPEEAYGPKDPSLIYTVKVADLPGSEELNVGEQVYLQNRNGQPFLVTVIEREGDSITFDANDEMAGKELNFRIELVEVLS